MSAAWPGAASGQRAPRVLVATACDSRFLPFLDGLLDSLRPVLARPTVRLACFDIGLSGADRARLAALPAEVVVPGTHFGLDADAHGPALRSFLARPFLREYFPGFDVYVWIDSDVWLQDPGVFDEYVAGAMETGFAITHESERAYRFQAWLFAWTLKHFVLGYGPANGARLALLTHVNAGFFAAHADAPHWRAWSRRYAAAIARTGAPVPHDQFALNHALHGGPLAGALGGDRPPRARLLDPRCNWICDRGVPMWNDDEGAFCKPYPPFEAIGALHLAGPAKRKAYTVRRTGGGSFETCLVRGGSPSNPVPLVPPSAAGADRRTRAA